MREIWKDVKEFEGIYQVSNLGRIKSLDRKVWNKGNNSFSNIKGRIIKLDGKNKDYYQVTLWNKLKVKKCLVHRLVAIAFIQNSKNMPEVNHLNCIKRDNKSSNLEWSNSLLNSQHAKINGKYDNFPNGIDKPNAKLNPDSVRHIRKKELRNVDYCKLYGIAPSTVSCLQSEPHRWKHIN